MTVPVREFPVKFPGYDFGPTKGLLDLFSTYKKEKLALATATHLATRAEDIGPAPQDGINRLLKIVDPDYKAVKAIGAAWPQLAQASKRNHRVIVLPLGLKGTTRDDMEEGTVLTNPTIEVVNPKLNVFAHFCLTLPGWGGEWGCPSSVRISADELPEPVLLDLHSTSAACHELDHLDGWNSIKRAIQQRRRLFYRPPEELDAWNDMRKAGQLDKWPWQIDLSRGGFDYFKFLRDVLDLEQYMKFRNKL